MKFYSLNLLLLFILFNQNINSQSTSKITIAYGDKTTLLSSINMDGATLVSLNELIHVLNIKSVYKPQIGTLQLKFNSTSLEFSNGNPFVIRTFHESATQDAIQLSILPIKLDDGLFVPVTETLEILNTSLENTIIKISPTRLQIIGKNQLASLENYDETNLVKNNITLVVKEKNEKSVLTFTSTKKSPAFSSFFRDNNLHLILWDVILRQDSVFESKSSPFINRIEVVTHPEYSELIFGLSTDDVMAHYEKGETEKEFSIFITRREYGKWYVKETEHFKCIFRDSHTHLVNYLLSSAENSLKLISELFNYTPSEKIIINTYDVSDYGFGGTTTIPLNFIRLEIAPLEPGYEVVPYNERFQWLLSHELVHIAVNDNASDIEKFFRSFFSKVNPEKNRPLTILFSLLTGNNRYTPRWHQEASAVFLETWLSGGYGRVLGNFDEMYFRSLVAENKNFPCDIDLDALLSHQSYLTETLYYIYGGRFATYLAINYGNEKLLKWFAAEKNEFYPGYKSKFKSVFNIDFSKAWQNFTEDEIAFQQKNIKILKGSKTTHTENLSEDKFGFVTEPYYSRKMNSMIFGYHRVSELAVLKSFDLKSFNSVKLVSLPSPSAITVASIAYHDSLGLLFYTTNNNQLYRDIRLYNLKDQTDELLFENCRTGHLTISSGTNELWGIQHNSAKAILVRSKYPYKQLETMVVFDVGDEIQQLAISSSGDILAAVIHKSSGHQSIILADVSKLDEGGRFQFITVTSAGSPENPYWSDDDKYLFWNAYTNGVSNIYKYSLEMDEIIPVTHTISGLFKPVYLSKDSLFAFEFTSDGMQPVLIPNGKAESLPAINYYGQKVLDSNPDVIDWNLPNAHDNFSPNQISDQKEYYSLNHLRIQTFIPTISGFQKNKVLGFYLNIGDPLLKNEIAMEFGISPFKEYMNKLRYHVKIKYDLDQTYYFAVEHNAPDFYDLFNKRKRGTIGNRFSIGHNDFWVYDNPLKIKQTTELTYYTDTKFINDNLIEVSEPDFFVFRTEFDYKDLRRSIGSFDFEQGNHFQINVLGFGAALQKFEIAPGAYFEWDNYTLYLFKHNVMKLKFAAGYHHLNDKILQAQFFFGGFGNRELENEPVRQYEKVFRFPGIPIYSIPTDNFVKFMFSNVFPPLRFVSPEIFGHYIKNINFSVFSQALITDLPDTKKWVNIGGQLNVMFSHWYNLESTLSGGIAKAWWKGGNDWEWFISYKLLRD